MTSLHAIYRKFKKCHIVESCRKIEDCKIEQRVNIQFLVKLRKSATETFHLFKEVYGEDCLSRTQAFEWHKRFPRGRTSVNDDDQVGRNAQPFPILTLRKYEMSFKKTVDWGSGQ